MRILLTTQDNASRFCALFKGLRAFSDSLVWNLSAGGIDMQCLDAGCCCLFAARLERTWFDEYEFAETDSHVLGFHTKTLHKVLGTKEDGQSIEIKSDPDSDVVSFDFKPVDATAVTTTYSKFFTVPLVDIDAEQLVPDQTESDADLTLPTRRFVELVTQLALFDSTVEANFTDGGIEFAADGADGEMRVELSLDDVEEYAIGEGERVSESYSLSYLQAVGNFARLGSEVNISVSSDRPLEAKYVLGPEGSHAVFYIAPRIKE